MGASALLALILCAAKPDVILFSFDAYNINYITPETAPHLTEYRLEATEYLRTYTACPWTYPSFQATFTGRWPNYITTPNGAIDLNIPMLGEKMAEAGYYCYGVQECSYLQTQNGFGRGFDIYTSAERAGGSVKKASAWIKEAPSPMFAFIHLYLPHAPYYCPGGAAFDGPDMNEWYAGRLEVDNSFISEIRERYRCNVVKGDRLFGEFIGELKKAGRYNDSLIIVMADHGEEIWEHGAVGHGTAVYDDQARVPLLIHSPGQKARAQSDRLTSLVDILPTLGKLLGFSVEGCHGIPLSITDNDREIFIERTCRDIVHQAIVSGKWKYIWNAAAGTAELYDMANDPGEKDNIVKAEVNIAAKMHRSLREHNRNDRTREAQRKPAYNSEEVNKLRALGYLQ